MRNKIFKFLSVELNRDGYEFDDDLCNELTTSLLLLIAEELPTIRGRDEET
jgi:hypothetical protein